MSLFDDNYRIFLEESAEGEEEGKDKDTKKGTDDTPTDDDKKPETECKEGNEDVEDPEEEVTDESAELNEFEMAQIEAAVDADIAADSVMESTGLERVLASEAEETHFACLEAVSANIAFDQCDTAFTEAFIKAKSQYEKDLVTESFKESVKKFGARFKAFLSKIKNAIIRIFNKAVNYVKILIARISAKFAAKIKLPQNWTTEDKIRINPILVRNNFRYFVNNAFYKNKATDEIENLIKSVVKEPAESIKTKLEAIKLEETKDMVIAAFGGGNTGYEDFKLQELAKNANTFIEDLKNVKEPIKYLEERRDKAYTVLKTAESAVRAVKDLDSSKINILTACVNKAMTNYNRTVNAGTKILLMWINTRVKVVRALKSKLGNDGSKDVYAANNTENKSVEKNSAFLFEDFLSMLQ